MNAEELRKSLDNGLRADSSGKTTPMGRLTPFLHDLVKYLAEREPNSTDAVPQAVPASPTNENGDSSKATA